MKTSNEEISLIYLYLAKIAKSDTVINLFVNKWNKTLEEEMGTISWYMVNKLLNEALMDKHKEYKESYKRVPSHNSPEDDIKQAMSYLHKAIEKLEINKDTGEQPHD